LCHTTRVAEGTNFVSYGIFTIHITGLQNQIYGSIIMLM
jgi:hypothetical protein